MKLCININADAGFQFDGDAVIPDDDLHDPASHQSFIEFYKIGGLLRIDGFDNSILKNQLIDGSSVTFKPGGFQPADAAPDNGLDASIVPVELSEHFTTDDDLGEAVIAALASFLAVGTGF